MKIKNNTLIIFFLFFVLVSPLAFSLQTSNYKQLEPLFEEVAMQTDYTVPELHALFAWKITKI